MSYSRKPTKEGINPDVKEGMMNMNRLKERLQTKGLDNTVFAVNIKDIKKLLKEAIEDIWDDGHKAGCTRGCKIQLHKGKSYWLKKYGIKKDRKKKQ